MCCFVCLYCDSDPDSLYMFYIIEFIYSHMVTQSIYFYLLSHMVTQIIHCHIYVYQ